MSQRGFTLIEVLITAFVLSVVTVAITGLSLVITRSSIESERATVAQGLLNEKLENLRAAYDELGYEVIAYSDESPLGMVDKEATVTRNNLAYLVHGFITLIDDPANGTLTEGTPLTETSADYAQVLYKASWTSNIGSNTSHLPVFIPTAYAAPSSVVSSATFFNLKPTDRACKQGTDTCPLKCPADAPSTCPDEAGNLTKTCSTLGICPDYLTCPASGKCSDAASQAGQPQSPPPPDQAQCPNGISTTDSAKEQCDLSVCGDGVDNDGDGGIDTAGAFPAPADKQCQEGLANLLDNFDDDGNGIKDDAGENKIFFEITHCIASEESCRATGGGQQIMGVLEPKVSFGQCSADRECGIKKFLRACAADCSKVSDDDCQKKRGEACLPDQSCTLQDDPTIENPCQGPGPGAKSICAESRSGACVECVAANRSRCGDTAPEICGGVGGGDIQCVCDYNRCAQCNAVNAKDKNCPQLGQNPKPYCWAEGACSGQDPNCGRKQCVECIQDSHCAVKNPDKPFCRTAVEEPSEPVPQCVECITHDHCQAKYPGQAKQWCNNYVCSDKHACEDLDDNDGDGGIDWDGGLGNLPDPQCENRFDDHEESFLPECSDGVDNRDFDGLIDWNGGPKGEAFKDTDCDGPEDPSESGPGGAGPKAPQAPEEQPAPVPSPPGNVVDF